MGITSGLGIGVDDHCSALKQGISAIKSIDQFSTPILGSALGRSNAELKEYLKLPDSEIISRTALLGAVALEEAASGLNGSESVGFINATTVGGMDLSENYMQGLYQGKSENPELLNMHDLGTVTSFLASRLPDVRFQNTISTACSSAANAIMIGAKQIKAGLNERIIVGGTDALCEFTIQGFKSLMVYSNEWCMPFSEDRQGLNLGEGAAYLLLESETSAKRNNRRILGYVQGYYNANDAFHSTGTSPEGKGAQLAMQGALKTAGIDAQEIDYVNAHGTATKNNDDSELNAMQQVFENNISAFSSTKAATGHTLAAAGAIEAVFSLISLQEQMVFGGLNCTQPMKGSENYIHSSSALDLNRVMSNSFGFGGNCTSLIFGKGE
jgi:3-oxoacyl-[acyl-carrier-protein] synthase-1